MGLEVGPTFRRIFHIASPVFLVYYLLPADLWIGLPKEVAVGIFWGATLVVEILRLTGWVQLVGIRDYERRQISAYFWGGTALALGLLFFPAPFVVVAMCGMAWVDPLCSYTRQVGGYPLLPLLLYGVIAFFGLVLLLEAPLSVILLLSAAATGVAIAFEYPTWPFLDDDFVMQMAPLLVMTGAGALLL